VPLDLAALLGCGLTTGWGSAVYRADVQPGEDVAVVGVGVLGAAALQGARLAGARRIFAVEPQVGKWDSARRLGATHTVGSLEDAFALIQQETQGRMCHKLIATTGVGRGELVVSLMALVAKRGRAVMTNVHNAAELDVKMGTIDLVFLEKEVVRLPVRIDQPAVGHTASGAAVQGRTHRSRRHGHPALSPGRDQPGLRGHAQRSEHPGCTRPSRLSCMRTTNPGKRQGFATDPPAVSRPGSGVQFPSGLPVAALRVERPADAAGVQTQV
jgi:hypothetical protein